MSTDVKKFLKIHSNDELNIFETWLILVGLTTKSTTGQLSAKWAEVRMLQLIKKLLRLTNLLGIAIGKKNFIKK